ncbi:hypothetical protein B0H66DRAFT_31713 [Apodospora peruviana]|uniref:Ankyrin repeat protein n=1 Tax=Apodospora peruviana TaxID=516989 RepID=A0AAE0IR39_9PEZI|nr:hypothetical protein B0H66DRAFT_31713 [Apodospora peruviana]
MVVLTLPQLPVRHADLVKHIAKHPETPLTELIEPYRKYEASLRQAYAQEPEDELLKDPYVNVLPLFTEDTPNIKVRARDLANESKAEKSKYIMPLPKGIRRPNDSPAVVQSFKEFQRNFNVFSESSLVELNWDNVIAAGSSVVNCLLPVPEEQGSSKRGLREFYHEKFCPASDVDLFLYGLTEEQAIEKIKDIEISVRDALLTETTTVRTKHAITICSQYPTRHIQIVLRIYKSVSEILTGFDIDCSGAAYDGKQVYCTPRALESYMTQINHIDLSRRSPSYENRLSKYSHRGFEVYWPDLDRSRVDPTIFERSFMRTLGLARLLVLERLPTSSARDQYLDKRRKERGRPRIDRYYRNFRSFGGNIKDAHEDEVADWVDQEEVSNYHTFTIPYGEKFHAKKIEKLCYTRDLLLNAEWNQPDDRDVYLHRHPAFFGRVEDVIRDCCGYCPVPETDEEKEIAEEESKIYVSGKISFIKDDPGRQQIGSFNPLTDDDWTEMAYVGNTARLCQAIVDGDVEHIEGWLAQEGADPNSRDYTGRTPLHLAVMSSSPEVVRILVAAGARLVSRLADGRTALHLAAVRGDTEIVKILMNKSVANEVEFEDKKDQRRQAKSDTSEEAAEIENDEEQEVDEDEDGESDGELVEDEESDDGDQSMATGSFTKVGHQKESSKQDDVLPEEDEDEPDFYDVNVIAWDTPCSALHLAIVEGHDEVVKTLCQEYGADILLPVKFLDSSKKPNAALLTLVLALALPVEKAKSMVKTILSLGATSAQADLNGVTSFHRFVEENAESLLDTLWELDTAGTKSAVNHTVFTNWGMSQTPLQISVKNGNLSLVLKLLENGAMSVIDFDSWLKSAKQSIIQSRLRTFEENQKQFVTSVEQPLIMAIQSCLPEAALEFLERGADPNVLTSSTHESLNNQWSSRWKGHTAMDVVNKQLKSLRAYKGERNYITKPKLDEGLDTYLDQFKEGTWQHLVVSRDIDWSRKCYRNDVKQYEKEQERLKNIHGAAQKMAAIKEAVTNLEKLEQALRAKGGKTFEELYPERKDDGNWKEGSPRWRSVTPEEPKSKVYRYTHIWTGVNDATEARNAAYIDLFEAAWDGDLEKIKKLTLTSWDNAQTEAPLKIAVRDQHNHTPFGLAFVRGHHHVAKAVLEITQAQYTPEVKPKTRFRFGTEPPEYSDDEGSVYGDSEASDDSEPRIYAEIVDAQFTIENVGQVSMQVNSHTKPLEFLDWTLRGLDNENRSPLSYVIHNKDMKGLRFLLDMGEYFGSQKLEGENEVSGFYSFPADDFRAVIKSGHTDMLAEIIRRTGAGLPLEHLVNDSGIEVKEKPLYYQGLTVYGKKRKDWATEGRNVVEKQTGIKTSPLLFAAEAGCIESVEWFLTDIPLRLYLEFTKSKAAREDPRLKHLAQAPGGFEGAISKWLKDQSDLVIHAAIYPSVTEKTRALLSFLVKTCPTLVNSRAANGATPLMLACMLGRIDYVKILIGAGADQTAKDTSWDNLLHAALYWNPTAEKLKPLFELLDQGLLAQMIKERNNLSTAGRTPLHDWFARLTQTYNKMPYNSIDKTLEVFKLLADISPESMTHALWMLDGAGDTPLHTLISQNANTTIIHTVLDMDPDLLFRESAVGRTPYEVAHDRFVADRIKPSNKYYHRYNDSTPRLVEASPSTFAKDENEGATSDYGYKSSQASTWRLVSEYAQKIGMKKRKLVSLHEANDVAKRLGNEHMKDRYKFKLAKTSESEDGGEDVNSTEASGEQEKPAQVARKKWAEKGDDFITAKYRWEHDAWERSKDKEEDPVLGLCSCGVRHD